MRLSSSRALAYKSDVRYRKPAGRLIDERIRNGTPEYGGWAVAAHQGHGSRRVLDVMATLPREMFVEKTRQGIAYVDEDIEVRPGVI